MGRKKNYPKLDLSDGKHYVYTHTANGMVYVGESGMQPSRRWQKSMYRVGKFKGFIDEVGFDNMEHNIICVCDNKDEAIKIEDALICMFTEKGVSLNSNRSGGVKSCEEYVREQNKTYREEHREERRAYQKTYNAEHREERRAYNKTYNSEHSEERRAYQKKYREEHREECRAYDKAYRDAHKDEISARKKSYRDAHRDEINLKRRLRRQAQKLRKQQSDSQTELPTITTQKNVID